MLHHRSLPSDPHHRSKAKSEGRSILQTRVFCGRSIEPTPMGIDYLAGSGVACVSTLDLTSHFHPTLPEQPLHAARSSESQAAASDAWPAQPLPSRVPPWAGGEERSLRRLAWVGSPSRPGAPDSQLSRVTSASAPAPSVCSSRG